MTSSGSGVTDTATIDHPDPDPNGMGVLKTNLPTIRGKSSNFDYNSQILVDDSLLEGRDGYLRPVGDISLDSQGPFEFNLPSERSSYLVLTDLAIYCKAKIVKSDGTDCAATDKVAPVNSLGTAMWSQIDYSLNSYPQGGVSNVYTNYKSYFETVLSYSEEFATRHLSPQMWCMDDFGQFELFETDRAAAGGVNTGFYLRHGITSKSKTFDMFSPITCDFLRSDTYLTPNQQLSLRLHRAKDSFMLMAASNDAGYKLKILDLRLYYYRVRMKESIPTPLVDRHLFTRTEMKKYPVPNNITYFNFSISSGLIPKQIVLAQVETVGCEGRYDKNPFRFQHFDVSRLDLEVSGKRYPANGLEPNFNVNPCLANREYSFVLRNAGVISKDCNMLTYKAFCTDLNVYVFDLTADRCNGREAHRSNTGHVSLSMSWRNPLPEPITLLVQLAFDVGLSKKKADELYSLDYI